MYGLFIGLAAAVLAIFSKEAMNAAVDSAALFTRGVMPALFPMLVLSALVPKGAGDSWLTTVLFSLLAGSPAAAQRIRGLYGNVSGSIANNDKQANARDNVQANAQDSLKNGIADNARLTALLGATGVMSPMFFLGTLAGWIGHSGAAWRLLIAHWLGAMLTGAFGWGAHRAISVFKQKVQMRGTVSVYAAGLRLLRDEHSPAPARIPLSASLPAALKTSAQSLLAVCAAMMLFSIVAALIRTAMERLLPELAAGSPRLLATVWALLEIGGGSAELIRLGAGLPLVCALCGFGGLSMCIQNLLFIGDIVSPARLLCLRTLHAALSYVICAILL